MKNKNRDLYYIHLFNDYSGSPRVLRDAIDSNANDAESTYVFSSRHEGFLDGVNAKRVNCFYARSNNRYVQLFYFLLSQALLFLQLAGYLGYGLLRRRKATVIINTMLPFGAGLAAKIMGTKVVYYVHETYIKPELLKQFLRFFIENCASHVIFVSRYLQQVESFSKPQQDVIYNGLRSDFIPITDIDKLVKYQGKIIFFAGSLKLYKGIAQLFTLAELLPEFNVVAAINCEDNELEAFNKENNLPANVTLTARPDNMQMLFATSFIVLNLSLPDGWIETFGLSLIEGMAFGSPVIAPQVGGPTEFVNNKNGALIDARNTKELVSFITHLNTSFEVWDEFSREAILTSQNFTAHKYKNSFKDYLKINKLV